MPSAHAHHSRFAPAMSSARTASLTPEALAQVCWALIFLLVGLAACAGAYHAYALATSPGYPVVALELLVVCLVIALCGLASSALAVVRAVRLVLRHG